MRDARHPVMVWVHGGGFTTGTGASALFSGRHLAEHGAVVVTINYRLGALGLLAHPDLRVPDEHSGANWALHDQLAALRWVRQNIGEFGGDPDNVTLFGESAGAMSIADLLAAPAAAGLFDRAVVQSGPPATATVEWAARRAERLADLAGVGSMSMKRLRQVGPEQLVEATRKLAAEAPSVGDLPLALLPVVDDDLLFRPPEDLIAGGAACSVPLLVGTTRDESALFTVSERSDPTFDVDRVVARLTRLIGPEAAPAVVDAYGRARQARGEPDAGVDLWTAITTDYVFRLPLLAMADAHRKYQPKTYAYLFNWESPFMNGSFGSCHGLEIPFVFGTVSDPEVQVYAGSGAGGARLAEQMQQAWVAFARSGDPTCDAVGEWPAYDPVRRPTMVLGTQSGLEDDPRHPERVVWEEAGVEVHSGHHHE
jgi:para-nitrobenzyl esterase